MPYYCAGYTITSYQVFDLAYSLTKKTKRETDNMDVVMAWEIAFDELYTKYSIDFQLIEDPGEDLILIVCLESETEELHTRDLLNCRVATHVRTYLERASLKPYKAHVAVYDSYPG